MVVAQPNNYRLTGAVISAYVLILCLEILLILIKHDPNIKGIENFEYCYLSTAYADVTNVFLKYKNCIVHLSENFIF